MAYGGESLSRYDVEVEASTGKLRAVARPRIFETSHAPPQPRLFPLDALGEDGWLKVVRLGNYVSRSRPQPQALQQALFAYHEAWG